MRMRRAHLCLGVCVLWQLSVNFPDSLFNNSDASLAVKRCGHTRDCRTVLGQYACITKKQKTDGRTSPAPLPTAASVWDF